MTAVVIVLVVASLLPLYFIAEIGWIERILLTIFIAGSLLVAFLLRPVKFSIDTTQLVLHKGWGKTHIALADITEALAVTGTDLGTGIRTFGSGGFFGYFGRFRYQKVGAVTAFVTDRAKMVLIKTKSGKKYLISPDDPYGFINTISQFGRYR